MGELLTLGSTFLTRPSDSPDSQAENWTLPCTRSTLWGDMLPNTWTPSKKKTKKPTRDNSPDTLRRELILRVWPMSTPRPTRRFEPIPPLSLRRRRRWTRSDGLERAFPTHNGATASNKSRPPSSEPKRPRSKKFCVRLYIFGTEDHPLYCSI